VSCFWLVRGRAAARQVGECKPAESERTGFEEVAACGVGPRGRVGSMNDLAEPPAPGKEDAYQGTVWECGEPLHIQRVGARLCARARPANPA